MPLEVAQGNWQGFPDSVSGSIWQKLVKIDVECGGGAGGRGQISDKNTEDR